jgi:hypothetical protein
MSLQVKLPLQLLNNFTLVIASDSCFSLPLSTPPGDHYGSQGWWV